eukprot:Hpha_TRINITY_DN15231_c1_g2::TRINITY_DN15231_c1_g2_i4::g.67649::m.67649
MSGNIAAVEFLLDKGTAPLVRKNVEESESDLVPLVVKNGQFDLLTTLLKRGGLAGHFSRAWSPGEPGSLRYIQASWPRDQAAAIVRLWTEIEQRRGKDPNMQFGLLREARAP